MKLDTILISILLESCVSILHRIHPFTIKYWRVCVIKTKTFTWIAAVKLWKSGNFTLSQYFYLQILLKFHQLFLLISFVTFKKMTRIQPRVTHCIWFPSFQCLFNNEQFLSISFYFMTLKLTSYFMTFLKTSGQLFCKMSLNLGLSDISSYFDSGYTFLAGILLVWCKHNCGFWPWILNHYN